MLLNVHMRGIKEWYSLLMHKLYSKFSINFKFICKFCVILGTNKTSISSCAQNDKEYGQSKYVYLSIMMLLK